MIMLHYHTKNIVSGTHVPKIVHLWKTAVIAEENFFYETYQDFQTKDQINTEYFFSF